jgi:hypothetical protein
MVAAILALKRQRSYQLLVIAKKTCHLEDTAANLLTSRIGGMNRRDLKSHFRTGHVRMTLQGINNGG